ncbi:uncharacterized protein LOC105431260 [Pogonomyrmex barbatus]|uniref:Uncharacterized protein LOC105431260 n=1 Tax=Pogonomyrmex barbatus TaxID=144034 RepID=A0A6I9XEP9_9HYME|nr:uncharacterized protein LOC105431260 [Pogonomyrmex barbatus]XP_011643645.1 uncharacterized protein LOC105431260 [Pogonomyrmex barbatus]XP_025075160.1 uncharacterized protein LOC105431260 [Pogonomyrmex barbatus]XP_025075161.1 uncharacterized protein LOC105431260 [Pogonomyrmex barbatus]
MKAIGRILAYALLAAAFTKNVLAMSAANVKFSRDYNKFAPFNITKLELVLKSLNFDAGDPRSILDGMFKSESMQETEREESRTFGNKRVQFMLMPMMYKMGVMMTMLMVITAISAKGLLIGVILLVLKLSTFLAKLHSGWHAPQPWSSPQPVHVHVHGTFPHVHPQMYQSWEPASGPAYEDPYYYKG